MITNLSKPLLHSEELQKLAEQLQRLKANPTPIEQEDDAERRGLDAFYHASILHGLAVALWRLPQETDAKRNVHAIADFSGEAHPIALDFQRFQPGFLISPFLSDSDSQARHLAAHAYFNGKTLVLSRQGIEHSRRVPFLDAYQSLLNHPFPTSGSYTACWYTPLYPPPVPQVDEEAYQQMVSKAVEFIRSRGIRKVVTSRLVERDLPPAFDPVALFRKLCTRYPHAFVSLVALPNVGTWIGATPETLVRIDDEEVRTMALAGTQARPTDKNLDQVVWGTKEIEEQAVVSADIRDFFHRCEAESHSQTSAQRLEEEGPHTVAAGNVVHLQTTFRVKVTGTERLRLANRILTELHPTSAVCGMPKERALSFIQEHEQHDRSFYSGFLGPVQIDGCSDLFVNLRCMQLGNQRAQLYVGGGITADSNPSAEWRETELKARTLLDVLKSEVRSQESEVTTH